MSLPKILILVTAVLFGSILMASYIKKGKQDAKIEVAAPPQVVEIAMNEVHESKKESSSPYIEENQELVDVQLPEADRIEMLFNKGEPKLPIVETIVYSSRVPWMKERAAWIADYASHYKTSRHFIARSLNGKPDYLKQDVLEGKRLNVFRPDKDIEFYLLVDASRCKMWFYYIDRDTNDRVLLKTYKVGLGRPDPTCSSGLLTPLGKYTLGEKVAIYKPKVKGYFNGEKTELITVFGTRWIPFGQEVMGCSAQAAGFGIHGVPWLPDDADQMHEESESLGKYASDGCIRLSTKDMEELFAIVISRPTTIEIVKKFESIKKPGVGPE